MAGWMRQTTRLIRSTIEENRSCLVYCLSATSSKSWSTTWGLRAFSRTPRAITDSGESWANRSKTSPRIIAVASLEGCELRAWRQLNSHIRSPLKGWYDPTHRRGGDPDAGECSTGDHRPVDSGDDHTGKWGLQRRVRHLRPALGVGLHPSHGLSRRRGVRP